jgi:FkbM family methyltransferase
MPLKIVESIARSFAIACLTRRYFRPRQCDGCNYFINGRKISIQGPYALSLVLGAYWRDEYGLRRFNQLQTIVDIGANIGVFSLHACTLFPKSNVIAYEPSDMAVSYLRKNTMGTRIQIRQEAVGDLGPEVFLHTGRDLTSATIAVEPARLGQESQSCRMISFAGLCESISGPISFLKLDCEGSEYGILRSPALNRVQNIAAEFHSLGGGTPRQGLELLREQGFEIEAWHGCPEYSNGIVWARNQQYSSASER